MALPVFRAASAKASGTGAVTPALPAGVAANDIVLLVATTIAGGSMSITANGSITTWNAVSGSPIDVASGEKLWVWWGRYASGSTGPTVTPGSDHSCACTLAYSGVDRGASPLEATATGTETTSDTSFSFATGVSTSGVNRLVLAVCSTGADSNTAQGSSEANSSLTSVASRANFCTNSGGGGGFDVIEGALAAAGSTGTFTATLGTATPKAYITFALIPLNPVTASPGVGSETLTGFAPTASATQNKRVTPGVGAETYTGFAPTAQVPRLMKPGVGAETFTGFAPTVKTPQTRQPGAGTVTYAGFAPAVLTPRTVGPGVGAETYAGLAPTVLTPRVAQPGVGATIYTGFAPTVSSGSGVTCSPGVGALTFTGYAPTVTVAAPRKYVVDVAGHCGEPGEEERRKIDAPGAQAIPETPDPAPSDPLVTPSVPDFALPGPPLGVYVVSPSRAAEAEARAQAEQAQRAAEHAERVRAQIKADRAAVAEIVELLAMVHMAA